jgi:hypothetical protein
MKLIILFISLWQISLFENQLFAQDERLIRKMISGELAIESTKAVAPALFSVTGPAYRIDLNQDGLEETIQVKNQDGLNWIHIFDINQNEMFKAKLWAMGAMSRLYKIRLVDLNTESRVLILHVDEGRTESVRYESTARLFIISMDKNNLSSLKMVVGPRYWHERKAHREQYSFRNYFLNVIDLDKNGTKEIYVKYHGAEWIYIYQGRGQWKTL